MNSIEIRQEIEEKLKDLYRITDAYVPLSAQGRFSEYDNAKEAVVDMINDYIIVGEEIEKQRREYDELKLKYEKLQEEIQNVSNDLYTLPDLDTDNREDELSIISDNIIQQINDGIKETCEKLEELADEDWKPEIKSKKKKK